MGIAERREREKEQRKIDIIDAAERIIFTKGIDNTTMDEIAEQAELSKGTLYLYFKNKEDLYLAIHLRGITTLRSMFEKAVDAELTGIEKTKSIGRAYIEFFNKYPDYFNAMIYYESHEINFEDQNSEAAQCLVEGKKAIDILVQSIGAGIRDKSIRQDIDPLMTAVCLWGQTAGVIQLAALKEKNMLSSQFAIRGQDVIDYTFDMIYHALRP